MAIAIFWLVCVAVAVSWDEWDPIRKIALFLTFGIPVVAFFAYF